MSLFLIIGGVVLSGLEIPSEIGDIGGRQAIAKHDFPGGLITITPLGAFPHPVTWSGIMTGTDAFSRTQKLDRLRALGNEVTLNYGQFAWSGVITSFAARPKHQWYVPYTITFEPIADLSGVGFVPFLLDTAETLLNGEVSAITSLIDVADGLELPGALGALAQGLLDVVGEALANGSGLVVNISTADRQAIDAGALALENACLPYALGTDPTTASPALDLSVRATAVTQIVGNPASGVRVVRAVNPNLFAVAQQFYGDASAWLQITQASGLPPDPQPIGILNLTVPLQ